MAGALGPFIGVKVSSMTSDVPDDAFGKVLDAFNSCSTFTVDNGKEVLK
jgi:hypothetical protein